jgi:hypothetical protein
MLQEAPAAYNPKKEKKICFETVVKAEIITVS